MNDNNNRSKGIMCSTLWCAWQKIYEPNQNRIEPRTKSRCSSHVMCLCVCDCVYLSNDCINNKAQGSSAQRPHRLRRIIWRAYARARGPQNRHSAFEKNSYNISCSIIMSGGSLLLYCAVSDSLQHLLLCMWPLFIRQRRRPCMHFIMPKNQIGI